MSKIVSIAIGKIKPNPNNPRLIKDDKFERLVKSIREFPEMLQLRPIVVNSKMIVLGGNMRLKACKEAGMKTVPVINASELTAEQQRRFIAVDNIGFGEFDWEMINNDWDTEELADWGLDVEAFVSDGETEDLSDGIVSAFKVEIECDSEKQQEKIFNEFQKKGYKCRLLTL